MTQTIAHPVAADMEIITQAIGWLNQYPSVILVTVAKTWGSSPRPAGSLLVINPTTGHYSGSVSGGCIETDLLTRCQQQEFTQFPHRLEYGVATAHNQRLGLPCGSRLELVLELLDSTPPLETLYRKITQHQPVMRQVCLTTGEVSLHPATPTCVFSASPTHLRKPFGLEWQLLLIGAGQIADCLLSLALMQDYQVIVCDPRQEYQSIGPDHPPPRYQRSYQMPDEAVLALSRQQPQVIVTLSHDPKLDDMALMEALALEPPAFYVGALGSRQSHQQRRQRLLQMGLTPHQLERLHAPVGLNIGSRTPAEIAVAIMAELIACRNLHP